MKQTWKPFLAGMAVMGALTFAVGQPRHPRIHAAVRALEEARIEMKEAAHDYCGHRVKAMEATNAALQQLNLAVQCANR